MQDDITGYRYKPKDDKEARRLLKLARDNGYNCWGDSYYYLTNTKKQIGGNGMAEYIKLDTLDKVAIEHGLDPTGEISLTGCHIHAYATGDELYVSKLAFKRIITGKVSIFTKIINKIKRLFK